MRQIESAVNKHVSCVCMSVAQKGRWMSLCGVVRALDGDRGGPQRSSARRAQEESEARGIHTRYEDCHHLWSNVMTNVSSGMKTSSPTMQSALND